ncbi:GLUG motif-containing protein [Rhodoferax sp. PAMC 29310]|uniref:GLUG motif-containing protein n=1 Tax=Rhodoferax sp. PAMC 29310 TaxID=2822760 RepID=UPI001B325D8E|nr:GLUG motif-containing protein [Rhodoferax sp. PAMC 29310]
MGGLLGLSNGGTINSAYATGAISGKSSLVGGLIGQARFYGSINNSYATGAVSAPTAYYVGGLVGQARFVSVNNSYATGAVTGGSATGGLVGYLDTTSVNNSYSTGAVLGRNVGGLIGLITRGNVTNSFWDTVTSGQASSNGGTGKTTAELLTQSTYTGWDFTNIWYVADGPTRPFLRSEYEFTKLVNGALTVNAAAAAANGGVVTAIAALPGNMLPRVLPGLYVSVLDGQINFTNRAGSPNFSSGQFGYTPSVTSPPISLPANPGLRFTPPPMFTQPPAFTTVKDGGIKDPVDMVVQ